MVTNTKLRCVGARRRLVASPGATRARARLTGRDSFGGRHHLLFSSGGVYPVRPTHRGTHTQTETYKVNDSQQPDRRGAPPRCGPRRSSVAVTTFARAIRTGFDTSDVTSDSQSVISRSRPALTPLHRLAVRLTSDVTRVRSTCTVYKKLLYTKESRNSY